MIIDTLKAQLLQAETAQIDSKEDVPIPDDEYYESDDWYEGFISALKYAISLLEREG